jgi:hypothetical protein
VIRDLRSDYGIKVSRTVPDLGLVDVNYFREGEATLQVCARNRGGTTCGNDVVVMLGPTFCSGPAPGTRTCPTGQMDCPNRGCVPLGKCAVPQ